MFMVKSRLLSVSGAVFLVLTLALSAILPLGTASAAVVPPVGLSQFAGTVGSRVTVSGELSTPGNNYQIRWDDPSTGRILASGSSGGDGTLARTVFIPEDTGGPHQIYLVDVTDANDSAWESFTIIPSIELGGSSRPGEDMIIEGTGFQYREENIDLTWDGDDWESVDSRADEFGSWSQTVEVPSDSHGEHTVRAIGDDSLPDPEVISVSNIISLSVTTGTPGTTVTVTGKGFYDEESGIEILWDGTPVKTGITANDKGEWSGTFTVPASSAGDHTIDARGNTSTSGQVPNRTFTVTSQASINPTSGSTGTIVTVTGTGFAESSVITIKYDGTAVTTTPSTVTSTSNGDVSATFIVPASITGEHTVSVSDGTSTASATFTISSSISSSPVSGPAGTDITVVGEGFPLNSPVNLTYDQGVVTTTPVTIVSDSTGAFTATFKAPAGVFGSHTITVTSGAAVETETFTITPTFSASPTSGIVGSSVTLSGAGFSGSATIVITYDDLSISTSPSPVTTSNLGAFSTTITLPDGPGGAHTVRASDPVTSAVATVNVLPSVTLDTTTTQVGSEIGAIGKGFVSGSVINVTSGGTAVITNPSPLISDASGGFDVKIIVPEGAKGSHTLSFTDTTSTAEAAFDIVPAPLVLSQETSHVGASITINGTGFSADSAITFTYDGETLSTTPTGMVSTALGSFQTIVVIPVSIAGEHLIKASDASGNTSQAIFTVESDPPIIPTLSTPEDDSKMGGFGSEMTMFTWLAVSDPSGVTYVLQITKDNLFEEILLEKEGIIGTEYTLSEEEAIGPGRYYWRVKAVDGASNESTWSQIFILSIGFLPTWMPLWLFIIFIVLGVGVIVGIVYLYLYTRPIA